MDEFLSRTWEMLIGRSSGPLTLRLILQPTMATLFAIRAGLADARAGREPYLWSAVTATHLRAALIREGWKHVRTVFLVALALDMVYQVIVFKWVYPLQSLLVAITLAIVPYLVLRGLVTRIARRMTRGAGETDKATRT